MGGKLFAVIVIVIALASAVPIINHTFMGANVSLPEDISTHGAEIDKQIDETMVEAGLSFLGAQLVLGFFVWQFGGRKNGPLKNFPGGAKYLVIAAVLLVGAEAIASEPSEPRPGRGSTFSLHRQTRSQFRSRPDSLLFISAMPGLTENSADSIPKKSMRATRISSGWIRRMTFLPATTFSRPNW